MVVGHHGQFFFDILQVFKTKKTAWQLISEIFVMVHVLLPDDLLCQKTNRNWADFQDKSF
jgi:hypothetical protein